MIPKILTLVRGLPGSGKSTFANTITNEFSVCEADKFFYDKEGNYNFDATKLSQAHKWCRDEVEIRMKDNQINEQAFVGVISFFAMVFVLFVDVITGIIGNELIIKEFEPLFVSLFFKSENNKKTLISFRNNFISNNTKEYKTTAFYLDTGTTFINGKFIEISNSGSIMNPVSLIGSKTQNEPFFLTQLIDFALIDPRSDSIFRAKEVETMIGWIKHYPQSFWFMNRVYANKRFFSSAELVKLYNLFDSKVQNSNQGKLLIDFATNSGQINFNFNQVIGKDSISLNQSLVHENEPSLIIFWASWCAPCRNEIPYLKSLYKKFGNYINFVSVSIDKNEDNWKSAIRIEKMPWQQLIVSESESLQLMKLLHFDSIPFMILVDSSANIISNYNEGFFELPNKRLESNISKLLNKF